MMPNGGKINGTPVVGAACGEGTGDTILVTADGTRWHSCNPLTADPLEFGTGVVLGTYRRERSEPDE